MAEYVYAVTGAVMVSELCMMLLPEGSMKRFAKTAVGVLVMMFMILPLQKCSAEEITFQRNETKTMYKTSYSNIIMDIYTQAMERTGVEMDGTAGD